MGTQRQAVVKNVMMATPQTVTGAPAPVQSKPSTTVTLRPPATALNAVTASGLYLLKNVMTETLLITMAAVVSAR